MNTFFGFFLPHAMGRMSFVFFLYSIICNGCMLGISSFSVVCQFLCHQNMYGMFGCLYNVNLVPKYLPRSNPSLPLDHLFSPSRCFSYSWSSDIVLISKAPPCIPYESLVGRGDLKMCSRENF